MTTFDYLTFGLKVITIYLFFTRQDLYFYILPYSEYDCKLVAVSVAAVY